MITNNLIFCFILAALIIYFVVTFVEISNFLKKIDKIKILIQEAKTRKHVDEIRMQLDIMIECYRHMAYYKVLNELYRDVTSKEFEIFTNEQQ